MFNRYLDLFSHKLCCFTDLESYMLVIASSESVRTKVVENIKQYMELNFPAEALEVRLVVECCFVFVSLLYSFHILCQ